MVMLVDSTAQAFLHVFNGRAGIVSDPERFFTLPQRMMRRAPKCNTIEMRDMGHDT